MSGIKEIGYDPAIGEEIGQFNGKYYLMNKEDKLALSAGYSEIYMDPIINKIVGKWGWTQQNPIPKLMILHKRPMEMPKLGTSEYEVFNAYIPCTDCYHRFYLGEHRILYGIPIKKDGNNYIEECNTFDNGEPVTCSNQFAKQAVDSMVSMRYDLRNNWN